SWGEMVGMGSGVTVAVTEAVTLGLFGSVAVIFVLPVTCCGVTRPLASTVATLAGSADHTTSLVTGRVELSEKVPMATNCRTSPPMSSGLAGLIAIAVKAAA